MVRYEDGCVGCPPEMGCIGDLCQYRKIPCFTCDDCGDELMPDELYRVEGRMLCKYCVLDMFKADAGDFD